MSIDGKQTLDNWIFHIFRKLITLDKLRLKQGLALYKGELPEARDNKVHIMLVTMAASAVLV